jgi:uncharacterized protein (DUF885 family)
MGAYHIKWSHQCKRGGTGTVQQAGRPLSSAMLRFHLPSLVVLALVLGAMVISAQSPTPREQLLALFERTWQWELSESPTSASALGDPRWNDRWDDLSTAAFERRQAHRQGVLRDLAAIPRSALPAADQTHYDVFKYQYDTTVEAYAHRFHLIRTATYDGVQNTEQLVDNLRFATVKDYEDWLARLERFPAYVDQNVALLREGLRTNTLLPKVIVSKVLPQIDTLATQDPSASGYYKPFRQFPDGVPVADRTRLAAAGVAAVRTRVQPAFASLRAFLEAEYLPATYERVGWSQTSGGAASYSFFARQFTTTTLTPQQIHDVGLKEVARIRGEMEAIKTQVGFKGTLAEFFTYLRTDPRFFYKTGPELLAGYRALAKRVDPELVKVIRTLPRLPYGVIPIPDAVAPNTTTAYANFGAADGSRPAYYFVNLYKPETRPTWEMLALTLHEAEPGHCLQGSIAQELGEMPTFRRHAGFTAYIEGWALYAESLGDEMGLYRDDPYAKFGQLTYQMWRAVRLVVDTGMHVLGWDREKAIRYFMDNAAKTELDVTNEIDRYISWPGQALAYKVGELKIWELRRRAETALGGKFDLRDFNDVILQTGAVPLDILEARVNEWIITR